ncbi:MAG: ATP-binding protein [Rhodothermia bacterium]|nr:MAG: ATP-binding protein [Rhodothermia bacterium]
MSFSNPFRPGAGHAPPYLAGRTDETNEFRRLLKQRTILENLILTGLRGVGKTVLLDTFKPLAVSEGWRWASSDLSESTGVSEKTTSQRLMTDVAVLTSSIVIQESVSHGMGFLANNRTTQHTLSYATLEHIYESTPGLASDKLKAVLELVWDVLRQINPPPKGIVFAYDEAQNMCDHPSTEEYPLSLLLDIFQSLQRKGIPFMLVFAGLPTLFPKLVEARTYSERMFRVLFLNRLEGSDIRDAIVKPIDADECPITFSNPSIDIITRESCGYPYFIQFICRETYDVFLQQLTDGTEPSVPVAEITRKLDTDFFAGRWARVTDRQRTLLFVIAHLDNSDDEFSVQDIVDKSKEMLAKSFGSSHTNQMLLSLSNSGLVYKNRHGRYSLAVPLLNQFIRRQENIDGLQRAADR